MFLSVNLIYRFSKKGQAHMLLLKQLNIANSTDSYLKTFMTGTFYKYPTLMLPYLESYENLDGKDLEAYKKVKIELKLLWYSIGAMAAYCSFLVIMGE